MWGIAGGCREERRRKTKRQRWAECCRSLAIADRTASALTMFQCCLRNAPPSMDEMVAEYEMNPDVSQREIEGELLLLTPNDDVLYTLNGSGRLVWERIALGDGLATIIDELASVFCIPIAAARTDVEAFVAELEGKGVLRPRG